MPSPNETSSPAPPGASSGKGLFAWALYDWANSAFPTLIQTFLFAAYFTRQVAENETQGGAMWGRMLGLGGLVVAVGGPLLGAVADQTGRRKPWLTGFTLACIAITALLWFIRPTTSDVLPALVLVGVATLCFEFANIFYNGMLPELAPADRIGRWSGWGWALGYAGGLLCLVTALFFFVQNNSWFPLPRNEAQHVRASFLLVSCWYLVFALPLFFFTPDTPATGKRLKQAVRDGFSQIGNSIRHVRRYRNIAWFLIARMIYVDGLATVFAFGGVFAAGAFDMAEQQVLLFGIALNVTAGLGAASFAWVDDWFGSKPTILLCLIGLTLPAAGMLMAQSQLWFWVFGLVLGIFVGPTQAASRSLLARMAPESLRNQMFGLYALSGKATSFLGPLMVGLVTGWTQSQRMGMSTILVLFLVGFILLWLKVPDPGKGYETDSQSRATA